MIGASISRKQNFQNLVSYYTKVWLKKKNDYIAGNSISPNQSWENITGSKIPSIHLFYGVLFRMVGEAHQTPNQER